MKCEAAQVLSARQSPAPPPVHAAPLACLSFWFTRGNLPVSGG